uniref:Aminotransferase-like plant mobile domain-containing protein n=1 Tax=Leersia perrieri TaxID=77586 RepID=A0A0D9VZC7_9ORYZ
MEATEEYCSRVPCNRWLDLGKGVAHSTNAHKLFDGMPTQAVATQGALSQAVATQDELRNSEFMQSTMTKDKKSLDEALDRALEKLELMEAKHRQDEKIDRILARLNEIEANRAKSFEEMSVAIRATTAVLMAGSTLAPMAPSPLAPTKCSMEFPNSGVTWKTASSSCIDGEAAPTVVLELQDGKDKDHVPNIVTKGLPEVTPITCSMKCSSSDANPEFTMAAVVMCATNAISSLELVIADDATNTNLDTLIHSKEAHDNESTFGLVTKSGADQVIVVLQTKTSASNDVPACIQSAGNPLVLRSSWHSSMHYEVMANVWMRRPLPWPWPSFRCGEERLHSEGDMQSTLLLRPSPPGSGIKYSLTSDNACVKSERAEWYAPREDELLSMMEVSKFLQGPIDSVEQNQLQALAQVNKTEKNSLVHLANTEYYLQGLQSFNWKPIGRRKGIGSDGMPLLHEWLEHYCPSVRASEKDNFFQQPTGNMDTSFSCTQTEKGGYKFANDSSQGNLGFCRAACHTKNSYMLYDSVDCAEYWHLHFSEVVQQAIFIGLIVHWVAQYWIEEAAGSSKNSITTTSIISLLRNQEAKICGQLRYYTPPNNISTTFSVQILQILWRCLHCVQPLEDNGAFVVRGGKRVLDQILPTNIATSNNYWSSLCAELTHMRDGWKEMGLEEKGGTKSAYTMDHMITWDPYTPSLIAELPVLCTFGSAVWRSRTPLICFQIVEMHVPDRVLLQFGMMQHIPDPVEAVERVTMQGKAEEDWSTYHDKYIKQWDNRLSTVVEQQDTVECPVISYKLSGHNERILVDLLSTVQGQIRTLLSGEIDRKRIKESLGDIDMYITAEMKKAKQFSLASYTNKPRHTPSASLDVMQMVAPTGIVNGSFKSVAPCSCVHPVQPTAANLGQVIDGYVEGNTILQLDKMKIIQPAGGTLDLGPPSTCGGTNDRTDDLHQEEDPLDVSVTEANLQDIISTPVEDAMADIMHTSKEDPADEDMSNGMLDPPAVQNSDMPADVLHITSIGEKLVKSFTGEAADRLLREKSGDVERNGCLEVKVFAKSKKSAVPSHENGEVPATTEAQRVLKWSDIQKQRRILSDLN